MSRFASVELNGTQNKEIWLPCSKCDGQTSHKVMLSINASEVVNPNDEFNFWEDYEVVQCQGCKTISFRNAWRASVDLIPDGEGGYEFNEQEIIYPGRVAGRHQLRNSLQLPSKILGIYNETHAALCNELHVLTGMGIRALIEAVCKDKSATGVSLQNKIDSLVSVGVLTSDGAAILHSLRNMGNDAAHEVKPHSKEELNVAFDVVENLLESVYLLPLKAKKLPKKNTNS
jgi:hypothetical protein